MQIQLKLHTPVSAMYNESYWTLNGKAIVNSDKIEITSNRDDTFMLKLLDFC